MYVAAMYRKIQVAILPTYAVPPAKIDLRLKQFLQVMEQ